MITIIISLLVGFFTLLLVYSLLGLTASILPAIAAMVVCFIILSRSLSKKIEASLTKIQDNLSKGRIELGLKELEKIKQQYGKWQIFLSSTIDGQIGSIYYMQSQFGTAKPYLKKAFIRHWVAKAMLALIYYREKKYKEMQEVFESITKINKKSGLLWSLWAYCCWRIGDITKAIEILAKGNSYLNNQDPILVSNLLSLQNSKKMKMKGYKEQWYQFLLEATPTQTQMKQGRVRFQHR